MKVLALLLIVASLAGAQTPAITRTDVSRSMIPASTILSTSNCAVPVITYDAPSTNSQFIRIARLACIDGVIDRSTTPWTIRPNGQTTNPNVLPPTPTLPGNYVWICPQSGQVGVNCAWVPLGDPQWAIMNTFLVAQTQTLAQAKWNFDVIQPGQLVNSNTFMLSQAPRIGGLMLTFINGSLMMTLIDYTVSGQTLTFTNPAAPLPGANSIVFYQTQ